jgi:hypothetical protein
MEGVLVTLAVLACPVGMGLMMWFMSKGMRRDKTADEPARQPTVEELRSEQAELEAKIERAEREQRASNGELARH